MGTGRAGRPAPRPAMRRGAPCPTCSRRRSRCAARPCARRPARAGARARGRRGRVLRRARRWPPRLPAGMDEDRVAAMSAALLSLGEKAAQGLGRGDLSQVYVEGETGTVFLISCRRRGRAGRRRGRRRQGRPHALRGAPRRRRHRRGAARRAPRRGARPSPDAWPGRRRAGRGRGRVRGAPGRPGRGAPCRRCGSRDRGPRGGRGRSARGRARLRASRARVAAQPVALPCRRRSPRCPSPWSRRPSPRRSVGRVGIEDASVPSSWTPSYAAQAPSWS